MENADRDLLTMRYTMNMSYREIADEIGSNEKAVGKRVERLVSKCQTIAEKLKLSKNVAFRFLDVYICV